MPVEIAPPEFAQLLDYAERSRTHDWSLRAALVRYAQPQPERVSALLEVVRRTEFALKPHLKSIERNAAGYWAAVNGDGSDADVDPLVIALLKGMRELDTLGDVLAEWAVDAKGDRPDIEVDAVTAKLAKELDELGIAREEHPPRPMRGRG